MKPQTPTRLEKVADSFIESYLKDHPIMFYSLDTELEEYLDTEEKLTGASVINEILKQYRKSGKKTVVDERIHCAEVLDPSGKKEPMNSDMSEFIQSPSEYSNPLIKDLRQLVIFEDKVRVSTIYELEEADQQDLFMPNEWIYHEGWNREDVLNYVRNYNDRLRIEDELQDREVGFALFNDSFEISDRSKTFDYFPDSGFKKALDVSSLILSIPPSDYLDSLPMDDLRWFANSLFQNIMICHCENDPINNDWVIHKCNLFRPQVLHNPLCSCCQTRAFTYYLGIFLERLSCDGRLDNMYRNGLTRPKIQSRIFGMRKNGQMLYFNIIRHLDAFRNPNEMKRVLEHWQFDFDDLSLSKMTNSGHEFLSSFPNRKY